MGKKCTFSQVFKCKKKLEKTGFKNLLTNTGFLSDKEPKQIVENKDFVTPSEDIKENLFTDNKKQGIKKSGKRTITLFGEQISLTKEEYKVYIEAWDDCEKLKKMSCKRVKSLSQNQLKQLISSLEKKDLNEIITKCEVELKKYKDNAKKLKKQTRIEQKEEKRIADEREKRKQKNLERSRALEQGVDKTPKTWWFKEDGNLWIKTDEANGEIGVRPNGQKHLKTESSITNALQGGIGDRIMKKEPEVECGEIFGIKLEGYGKKRGNMEGRNDYPSICWREKEEKKIIFHWGPSASEIGKDSQVDESS